METVKIKNIKTGVIKTVKKSLASDFIGTNEFILIENYEPNKKIEIVKKEEK